MKILPSAGREKSHRTNDRNVLTMLGSLVLCLAGLALIEDAAWATTTYTVNTTLDEIDDNVSDGICHTGANTCTLRAAVMQASRAIDPTVTIALPPGHYVLTRQVSGVADETNGDLNFLSPPTGNPTIRLFGADRATTIIDANQIDRAITVEPGRTLDLRDVTVLNGRAIAGIPNGGGIRNNSGTLIVSDSRVQDNVAGSRGGAIHSTGSLTLFRCDLSANQATFGGALYAEGAAAVTDIRASRVLGNQATQSGGAMIAFGQTRVSETEVSQNSAATIGGGIVAASSLTIVNTTIANNLANTFGGGLTTVDSPSAITNIYNSTIVGNAADQDQDFEGLGGGVYTPGSSGQVNIYNTIIAGNTVSNSPQPDDCRGIIKTHARNLFGNTNGCTIDQISGSWDFLNSLNFLGPLQNNGGPTQTIALLAGSNAINAGTPGAGCLDNTSTTIAIDQREFPRNVGVCDLGAYEFGAIDPNNLIFRNGFEFFE
jgi:predicted outer membrane repeat protein